MNKIFKVVWSKTKNSYVVVSEIAKRSGKCSSSLNKKLIAAFLAAGTVITINSVARAEIPEGTATGLNAVAIGVDSAAAGIASTVVGTGSIIGTNTKYLYQGATSNIFGAYNSIRVYDNKKYPYDGVASSIIGVANDTYMSNGALIFGAGNSIQKSYGDVNSDVDFVAAAQAYASESSEENYKALQAALINAVAKSGGNVMAIGGANKAEFANYSELIGVGNELHGTSSTKLSTDTYLNGHNNVATYTSNVTAIGSGNHIGSTKGITANTVILGDNNNISTYDKGLAVDNIVIGNNHTLDGTGTTDSTKAKNNIILGSWDEKTDEGGNQITHARKLQETIMIGHNADVQGNYGVAVGNGAVAKLTKGIAIGKGATAVKNSSIAIGDGATAEGQSAIAIGSGALAKGSMAVAFGRYAVAEGGNAFAHDQGIAKGTGATAWGSGQALKATSTAWGAGSKATGNNSTAWGGPKNNSPSTDPRADIYGHVFTEASGHMATAFGQATYATGMGATTWGRSTIATEQFATAFGSGTQATNYHATSFGTDTLASGYSSTAFGKESIAAGRFATAYGSGSKAFGDNSMAVLGGATGEGSITFNTEPEVNTVTVSKNAIGALAAGEGALALKSYTYAIGKEAIAQETNTVAIGNGSEATAEGAIVFGNESSVTGKNSIAIGTGLVVSGEKSGAFGDPDGDSEISGNGSYAFGNENNITSDDSFILGNNAEVSYEGGVALGANSKVLASDTPTAGGFNPVTGEEDYTDKTNVWTATTGPISVGSSEVTRQIKYVAAGSADTDAVNVAQLKASQVEIIGGDNVEVIKDISSGHTVYTIHSLNAIVDAGKNITVTPSTPETTTKTNGQTTNLTTGETGETTSEPAPSPEKPISPSDTNNHTTTYTVSATGSGGGIAEISFNGDNKDAQIDSPKVLNIEGGATGELTDGNIGVESDGKDTLTVKLAKDIKGVDSITVNKTINVGDNTTIEDNKITVGDTVIEGDQITTKTVKTGDTTINNDGLTIKNGPSVTKDGIDGGGKKITNVAPGSADTDAVNMSQLREASGDIYNEINRLDNSTRKGIAGAAALAALHPMDFNPDDKLQFSAGVGNYRGETAAALGMFYRPDESVMFSIGGTFGNSDNMVNAGITFGLDGTRNRITRSRTAMAHEIVELRDHIAKQDQQIAQLTNLVNKLVGPEQRLENPSMFPDVPENHWAYQYVEDLQKRGIIEGYPDGNFAGSRSMTRYEFAAMLDRALQKGVKLDADIAKEFEAELGRIYVERIAGQDNDRKKIERVRVNNSDSKYPEGKTRDVYGSKIVTTVSKTAEAK